MPGCPHCGRATPPGAQFCHFDGRALTADAGAGHRGRFSSPFVLPSGRSCATYDELIRGCLDDWGGGVQALRNGRLEMHLAGIGRIDLARAAQEASQFPDPDQGLDQLLRALPGDVLGPARLAVTPGEVDLGMLRVGQAGGLALVLSNEAGGLIHGTIDSSVPWLVLADDLTHKRFAFLGELVVPVRVRGEALRAAQKPQEARLVIASSGGTCEVTVRVDVPTTPFAYGILAGARTPRQLADKARAAPRDAVRQFESGAVARWYRENGWAYPVEGDPAPGVAGVQQFFDALGLSRPPRLELSEQTVELKGKPGGTLHATIQLTTPDKRPLYARVSSDHSWLQVRGVDLDGPSAHIRLCVPSVPDWPGETAAATVTIVANCRQRLEVPVSLHVAGPTPSSPAIPIPVSAPSPVPPPPPLLTPAEAVPPPLPLPLPSPQPRRAPLVEKEPTGGPSAALFAALAGAGLVLFLGLMALVIVAFMPSSQPDPPSGAGTIAAGPGISAPPKPTDDGNRDVGKTAGPADKNRDADRDSGKAVRPIGPIFRPADPAIRPRPVIPPPVMAVRELKVRQVEVVFCLDTTGSMGGLLDGAKAKVWAMCSQIAGGKPTPDLKVGLVAYKDRGDEYVTKVVPLNRDLDAIHAELNKLTAAGGGDIPESVNQALDDAVNKIEWSSDARTMRLIFLVGDAPPHMDYPDDVKYPVSCAKAVEKGILVNTIQCGRDAETRKYWKDIAEKGKGEFVEIAQEGGVRVIDSPFDAELAKLGGQLYETALLYGPDAQKRLGERALASARALSGAKAADRAVYAAKARSLGPFDLLGAVKKKRVKLADVKEEELPDALKALATAAERERHLAEVDAKREKLREAILELETKRNRHLLEKMAGTGTSFDSEVLSILRKQAKKFDIEY